MASSMRSAGPTPRSTSCPDHRSVSVPAADALHTMRSMAAETPRIQPLPPDQWDERLTRVLSGAPGGTAEPMHIFATLAHQPELFRRWLGFGGALLDGRLPGRLRELIILRTAFRFNGRY